MRFISYLWQLQNTDNCPSGHLVLRHDRQSKLMRLMAFGLRFRKNESGFSKCSQANSQIGICLMNSKQITRSTADVGAPMAKFRVDTLRSQRV